MAYNIAELAYINAFGDIGALGTLPEPFPTKYGVYPPFSMPINASSGTLNKPPLCGSGSGDLCRKSIASTATVKQAIAYAAGSWATVNEEAKGASSTKQASYTTALYYYRLAYDIGIWGINQAGVDSGQVSRFVAHLKSIIVTGDGWTRKARGVTSTDQVQSASPSASVAPSQTTFATARVSPQPSSVSPATSAASPATSVVSTEVKRPMSSKIFGLNRNLVIALGVAAIGFAAVIAFK